MSNNRLGILYNPDDGHYEERKKRSEKVEKIASEIIDFLATKNITIWEGELIIKRLTLKIGQVEIDKINHSSIL